MRLMRGKPCPGAGGRAGRGPLGGLVLGEETGEGEAFLLKGFSLQVRLGGGTGIALDAARGLGVVGGLGGGGLALRLLCGVAGADLGLGGWGGGEGLGERRLAEVEGVEPPQGPQMEGSDTLLVKGLS